MPPPPPPPPGATAVAAATAAAPAAAPAVVATAASTWPPGGPKHKKHPVVLTAKEIAELPNWQGSYNARLPPPPGSPAAAAVAGASGHSSGGGGSRGSSSSVVVSLAAPAAGSSSGGGGGGFCLCVKNPRTGRRTLFFKYYAMFGGFVGPARSLEEEAGDLALEWVARAPGTEALFCTPFTLFGFRYKPVYRLGALSIRRTLDANGVRLTGKSFASSHDADTGEANDWRLMWLQKNNHSGAEHEEFAGPWARFTKVGFPLRFYRHLRRGTSPRAELLLQRTEGAAAAGTPAAETLAAVAKGDDAEAKEREAEAHARASGAPLSPLRHPWASQFINHFPGSEALDNKSTMAACVREAARRHPEAYATGFPLSFCLPGDLDALDEHLLHRRAGGSSGVGSHGEAAGAAHTSAEQQPPPPLDLWLLKPPDLGGGHGIEVVTTNELRALVAAATNFEGEVVRATDDHGDHGGADGGAAGNDAAGGDATPQLLRRDWVVQKYISRPKLLDGFKHDLRLFFVVTSLDPVVAWSYPNAGIVKFCSSKYSCDPADLKNAYVHLGNQCLNITNPAFHQEDGVDGTGPRWSLGAWRARMEAEGHDTERIQRRVDELIAKVVLACQPRMLATLRAQGVVESQCYELFGIDVVVDEAGEPWLIEINNTPGYGNNKTIDNTLFFPLLADTWTVLGIDMPRGPGPDEDGTPPADDDVVDRFEDQLARRRHMRCVFPVPELVPLVQVRSTEAERLYSHVVSGGSGGGSGSVGGAGSGTGGAGGAGGW